MEIRRLFTTTTETPPPERFIAIQIQEGVVRTAVWQMNESQPEVVALGSTEIWSDSQSLVMSTDASLSSAYAQAGSEPDRVVFGLPESWIESDKIASQHAPFLKAILEQLELKALGFVGTTEAILQYLRVKEGIPPSVILVELGQSKIGVIVTRLGETIGRQEVGRSADVGADVEEALARMSADQLPSRILVTDGRDLEVVQQLTSYPWQEKLPFLHLPKVESLDQTFSIVAVAVAGGSEAAKAVGVAVSTVEPAVPTPTQTPIHEMVTSEVPTPRNDLGFVTDADIQDVEEDTVQELTTPQELPEESDVTPINQIPQRKINGPKLNITALSGVLKNVHIPQIALPKITVPKLPGKGILIAIPIVLLLLAVGSVFGAYLLLAKAAVVVTVNSRSIDKTVTVAVGGSSDTLPVLNATTQTQELEKTGSMPTTGEAVVGDKATGDITLFNKTDMNRSLPRGTVLATGNGLRFTIDNAVTLASRSAQETTDGVNIVYGQTKVSVTAAKIGAEYNLASNVSLSVGDFPKSSVEAKVTGELSGGTSRTVKAVAQADKDALTSQLNQQIRDEAQTRFAQNGGTDKTLVMQDVKVISQSFNKGVGEEADQLTLTMQGQVTILHVSQDDLKNFVLSQIRSDLPSGFDVDMTKTTIDIQSPQSGNNTLTASVPIHAPLTPQISLDRYREQLAGKDVQATQTLLQDLPGFQRVRITISPKIPFFASRMPTDPKKIDLKIESVQ